MNGVDSEKLFDIDGFWHKNQRPQPWEQATTDIAENEDFLIVLSDCLQKLPAPLQTAVQLKYFEEKKGEVICQELNLSPTNFWQKHYVVLLMTSLHCYLFHFIHHLHPMH